VVRVVLVWEQFGPYHMDRCERLGSRLPRGHEVVGLELAPQAGTYEWRAAGNGRHFHKRVLFGADEYRDAARSIGGVARYLCALRNVAADSVFLCNERPVLAALGALFLRVHGVRVFNMTDSKFDDKPRDVLTELVKAVLYWPYSGVLVSGPRALAYSRFHRFRTRPVRMGYDSLSVDRIRRLAATDQAPEGTPFLDRDFAAICRFVPKKNLDMLLDAYAEYRRLTSAKPRRLVLCGAGELEGHMRERVARERTEGVVFAGFLQEEGVALVLARCLSIVLPSTEEQWGLVINEALAAGVPVLCSVMCGAADVLVRTAVNGYIFEPDNVEGLARLMDRLATDEEEWCRLSSGATRLASLGDVDRFVEGVAGLLGIGTEELR
jgi:L-malate glycosyltransferase